MHRHRPNTTNLSDSALIVPTMTDSHDGSSTKWANVWHEYQQILEREKALAFLVKVKARTHKANPSVFTSVGKLLVAFKSTVCELRRHSSGDHHDVRMHHEADNLTYTVAALLAHDRQLLVDFQYYVRTNYPSSSKSLIPVRLSTNRTGYDTSHDRHPQQRVADLVEKMRVLCEEGGGQERYESCMETMEDYFEDVIDYREFMRRILSLDRDRGFRRDFISQFCGDVDYL